MGLLNMMSSGVRTLRGRNRKVDKPEWYESQGSHPAACGPAVEAMATNWSQGTKVCRERTVLAWDFTDIKRQLKKRGITPLVSTEIAFHERQGVIARIRAGGVFPHFVFLTWQGDELLVADPLSGPRLQTVKRFTDELINPYCLIVDRHSGVGHE